MLITNKDWKATDHLTLGVQTNPKDADASAADKALYWAPKRAKSMTITLVNNAIDEVTGSWKDGYPSAEVQYYTGVAEGKIRIK